MKHTLKLWIAGSLVGLALSGPAHADMGMALLGMGAMMGAMMGGIGMMGGMHGMKDGETKNQESAASHNHMSDMPQEANQPDAPRRSTAKSDGEAAPEERQP
ncbi:MAG: hypothetical protein AB1810_06115 [Pseudomonadota bacterium]